ncbi:MAG TPA: hypothetical protein VK211_29090 [Kamptonema sp.]|nr:hypothetical protein [Kamptonema sp.]
MAARKDERLLVSPVGEFYEDLLTVDARINSRSLAAQASSLLCAKLQERESKIRDRVLYLANKRGITFDEMWAALLRGEKLEPDEVE